ncbi:MAG: hypothetical protein AVDCRST_MAG73-2636 [uncultured Thermomicrobiales bacterium]|uniref:Uncharacterized protein n=1 Tax=uncultured Thermomicrobiales bacterium TaxID=1645740 RepID=A0A6J4UIM9_9BACT|nr:MAG: hypothetical protein AVDCRST_MAG73-2636 [uncultured Thermomicrobiales bacterium]
MVESSALVALAPVGPGNHVRARCYTRRSSPGPCRVRAMGGP